jgi:hypothetical protein
MVLEFTVECVLLESPHTIRLYNHS